MTRKKERNRLNSTSGNKFDIFVFLALTRNSQRRAAKANLKKRHREHYHITRRLHQHPVLRSTITVTTTTYQLEKKATPGHISGRIASLHMTAYCFDVLYAALRNHQTPKIPPTIPNDKYPLFVTWKKGYDRRLRGCIGTFTNLVLHKGLHEYAIISAFKDSRFDPITLHEVDQLHCTVSILINFEKARDYRDWVVGIHGIRIEFQDNHHYRDAVYLPEVASEQGWDHTETIDNLMRKGGYRGHISEETRMKVNVVRFQSDKVLMSYQEYVDYKSNYGEPLLTDPGGRRGLFHSCRP
uniref:AMMECR1 domain-containing protein n=2 Tax=Wuchereria bancrofti TaxID=6293 RepID=A0A1I8EK85_WUCBA